MTPQRTPSQERASTTLASLVAVVAGPGAGKTKTIVDRIHHLIEIGVDPKSIAVVTFTNAAAREIDERIKSSFDLCEPRIMDHSTLGHCGTLHSLALRVLRESGEGWGRRISVISPDSAEDLLAEKAKVLNCRTSIKRLIELKREFRRKSDGMTLDEIVILSHLDDLRVDGIVDYDQILADFLQLLKSASRPQSGRFEHLIVDEAQDSAPVDWQIYDLFPASHKFFVGDPDQAIYRFRGGSIDGFLSILRNASFEVIKLEENFRSSEEICSAANRLVSRNARRFDKCTVSASGSSGFAPELLEACANEGEEIARVARAIRRLIAQGTPASEIAVLARTNAIASGFLKTLEATGVPIVKREIPNLPPDTHLARAAVEHFADPRNRTLAVLFLAAQNEVRGMIEKKALSAARARVVEQEKNGEILGSEVRANDLHSIPSILHLVGCSRESCYWTSEMLKSLPAGAYLSDLALAMASGNRESSESGEGVHVLTFHAAKGREWDAVFVVGMEDETCPSNRADADVEEERRAVYVAATRARRHLFFSYAVSRVTLWGKIETRTPSRFLAELTSKTELNP